MSCNKCRQAPRFETDTWCLACSAWEQLGIELVSAWHSPAVRALASESVVHTTRHVRALRNLASSLRSAGDSRAAGSSPAQKAERPGTAKKELPPPPPPPVKREEDDLEEDGESETEESEEPEAPCVAAKSDPARRPAEPREPPRLLEASREERERDRRRERSRDRSHRDRHSSPGRKKKTHRGRRGGRNPPGLHRTLERPDQPVRRKPPGAFWDTRDRGEAEGHRAHSR